MSGTSGSLLKTAKRIRAEAKQREGMASGFTKADQEDILAHIEKIASQNRIQVSPQLFKLRPKRQGWGLALIINIGAIFVVALGLYLMYLVFSNEEESSGRNETQLQSAEGRLLQEIKKQSEAELAAKDKQLQDFESRISQIQAERNQLSGTMEDRIRQREAALRAELEAAIQAERERLRAQGYSEAEIERRVKEFEQRKLIEFNQQLSQFRRTLEAEKAKAESELLVLENQFNSQINRLATERETLLSESRKREEELRQQLALAQNQAGSTPRPSTNEDALARVRAAQEQIEKLNQTREQERNLGNQISGFYGSLRGQLNAKEWTQALGTIETMRNFLRAPVFNASESLLQIKEKELFSLQTFELYIEKERSFASSDLVKNAGLISEAQSLFNQAQQAEQAGNRGLARNLWDRLLQVIPGGTEATRFKVEEEKRARQTELEQVRTALTQQLSELAKTNTPPAPETTKEYLDLMARLRGIETQLSTVSDERARLAEQVASLVNTRDANNARGLLLGQELTNLEGQLSQARQRETTLGQVISQLERDKATLETSISQVQGSLTRAEAQNQEREERNAELRARVDRLVAELAQEKTQREGDKGTIAELKNQLQAALSVSTDPQVLAQLTSLEQEKSRNEQTIGELQSLINTLKVTESRYQALVESYKNFESLYGNINARDDPETLTKAKLGLESFLNGPSLTQIMPGLVSVLRAFDGAMEEAGGRNAMVGLSDSLFVLATERDRSAREAAIREQIDRAPDRLSREFWTNVLGIYR